MESISAFDRTRRWGSGKAIVKGFVLFALPLISFVVSLFIGRLMIPPLDVIKILASKILMIPLEPTWADYVETVVWRIRLPRAIAAMAVGGGLSVSGASFQGMFHNPLVSPYILGVSAGAGFGAALSIILALSPVSLQILAFCGGLTAVSIAFSLSRVYKTTPTLMLILSGVVVSAFFQAFISLLKYMADTDDKLPAIVFWLMGSMSHIQSRDLMVLLPMIVIGAVGLLSVRWRINVLSMGDREARAMGVNTELMKGLIIFLTTVISSVVVAYCGIIGWVGLVIPHVCRMIVGPDHRVLLPATLSVGATYLVLIDNLARILSLLEVPLGILTAIIGAPFFAALLRKTRGGWR